MLNKDICWYCSRVRNGLPTDNKDGWQTFDSEWFVSKRVFCPTYGYINVRRMPKDCQYAAEQAVLKR